MTSPQKSQCWSQCWNVTTRQFVHPKSGHSLSECEDALALNLGLQRFAVADGATEAFDARRWAQQIVRSWVELKDVLTAEEFWNFLETEGQNLSKCWNELQLPWYSEEKARFGSFAAFIGVDLDTSLEQAHWRAIALGDSCLVQCRDYQLLKAFPVAASKEFSAAPVLAPSCTSAQTRAYSEIAFDNGSFKEGDLLLLLSDSVAAWFLKLVEEKEEKVLSEFTGLVESNDDKSLALLLERERISGQLKDDDVAVLSIQISRV
jgi:hypothetical protein